MEVAGVSASGEVAKRNCVACGRTIEWNANLCPYCGKDYRMGQGGTQVTQMAPPKESSSTAVIIAIVVALVVVVVIVGLVLALGFSSYSDSSAAVTINVNSDHLFSVSYNLYVDGELVSTGTVHPGYYMQHSYTHHWSSAGPTIVEISASSTGSGLGSMSDSRSITVENGGSYTVNLFI